MTQPSYEATASPQPDDGLTLFDFTESGVFSLTVNDGEERLLTFGPDSSEPLAVLLTEDQLMDIAVAVLDFQAARLGIPSILLAALA